MYSLFIRLTPLILIMLLGGRSLSAEPLRVVNDYWPPFSDASQESEGLALELLRRLLTDKGYQFVYEELPWQRVIKLAEAGQVDLIVGLWHTPERARYLTFSQPYYRSRVVFLKRRDDAFQYTGLDSLNGRVVGTIRGYQYGDEFLQSSAFKRRIARQLADNISLLRRGRIDLTLDVESVVQSQLANMPEQERSELEIVTNPFIERPVYIACPKTNLTCKTLIDDFNASLAEFKSRDDYKLLLNKYGL